MTRTPPLLPEEVLARVLRMARMNGMSMMLLAGFFALLSAMGGDFVGAIAGLVVAGAGAMEVHGGTLLAHYDTRGTKWLVGAELVAWVGILVYCAVRLLHVQLPPMPEEVVAMIEFDARQLGISKEEFILKSYQLGFVLVAVGSTAYQGGMVLYYLLRQAAVVRALEIEVETSDLNA